MDASQGASSCTVVHAVPGRVRLRCSQSIPAQEREVLQDRLAGLGEVLSVAVRPLTSSVIIRYDARKTYLESFTQRAEELLQAFFDGSGQMDLHNGLSQTGTSRKAVARKSRSLALHGLTALGLTALLLYGAWRRVVRRKPLPQNLLSLTGVMTVIGSIPLFLRAWREWKAGRRMGLFPFLGISSLIALLAGAASTAMNIVWTLSLGMFLEELAMEKARRDVRKMVETAPQTGQVLEKDLAVEKRLVDIRIGETVVVNPGWIIPVDGVVAHGQALVNESQITGHQFPELRAENDWVYGGTTVQEGSIQVEVKRSGRDTYLSKVLDLVEEALDSRSEVERKADVLAGRMVRIGTVSTVGTLIITRSLSSAIAVLLVMSCPCATILAASTALTASIASAARRNILIKSGSALETMDRIDCICFDKTGTITQQLPELVEVRPRSPWIREERVLEMAAGAEAFSQHPIARTVVQTARNRQIQPAEITGVEVVLGRGVRGYIQNEEIAVGSGSFLQEGGVDISYFKNMAAKHIEQGRSPLYLAKDGKVQAMLILEAVPQLESKEVLSRLKESGIFRLSLVSGDDHTVVQALCASLPFDECLGEQKPEDKTAYIRRLQGEGHAVGMIGDGVNDALALSAADLGLAIGAGGSDAALEAADIVFMGDDLRDIGVLRALSQRSMRTIDQNFWIGAGSDYFGLGLAFLGLLTPMLGGIIHVGHTVAIMANSSRLLGWWDEERTSN